MRSIVAGILLVFIGLVLYGCPGETVTDPNQITFPPENVSYREHAAPFLALSCGQCHGETTAAGGIILTNYSDLFFSRPNLVVPELPDESLLNQVLEQVIGHPVGNIEFIPQNHVTGMRTWVEEGALNN